MATQPLPVALPLPLHLHLAVATQHLPVALPWVVAPGPVQEAPDGAVAAICVDLGPERGAVCQLAQSPPA